MKLSWQVSWTQEFWKIAASHLCLKSRFWNLFLMYCLLRFLGFSRIHTLQLYWGLFWWISEASSWLSSWKTWIGDILTNFLGIDPGFETLYQKPFSPKFICQVCTKIEVSVNSLNFFWGKKLPLLQCLDLGYKSKSPTELPTRIWP